MGTRYQKNRKVSESLAVFAFAVSPAIARLLEYG